MDDSCAVCAEALQWVAYGSCGHREVCSTCGIRLRFICEDRRCCLCKSESRIIFVTKVFICEQKLYTKARLDQHIKTGDSEFDGSETESGRFMGHPMCEFCQDPFYGENELYSHMSTEHCTCHICQSIQDSMNTTKTYHDLEFHFRQAHFLCEDEACLEKNFVVHATESETKRHNAMEHGGRMSRSKRIAALQIPISFQYRRSTRQDRRGRGCRLPSDLTNNQLPLSIQASLETSNAESSRNSLSSVGPVSDHRETSEFESVSSFEVVATTDCKPSLVCSHALRQNPRTARLEDSSLPPLPAAPSQGKMKRRNAFGGLGGNSTARLLHHQNNAALTIHNTSPAWPAVNCPPNSLVRSSQRLRPVSNSGLLSLSSSPRILQIRSTTTGTNLSPSYQSTVSVKHVKSHESPSSGIGSSSRNSTAKSMVTHSASSPNLNGRGFFDNSL